MDPNRSHTPDRRMPDHWDDDQKMNVYFSPFRQRSVNPKSWNAKLKFWSEAIHSELHHQRMVTFDAKTVSQCFRRNGQLPSCMDTVLSELARSGKIQKTSDFIKASSQGQGWMNWCVNTFVKSPVSWGVGMVRGNQPSPLEGEYVLTDLLQEMAGAINERVQNNVKHSAMDSILDYAALKGLCSDLVNDDHTLDLVIMRLRADGKLQGLTKDDGNNQVLKFAKKDNRSPSPITEVEMGILKLKNTEEHLRKEIDKLTQEIDRCLIEAKSQLSKNLKSSAKHALRRKKLTERTRDKREASLETIQTLLHQIENADSEQMVLEAYKSGIATVKQKTEGVTVDSVEDVMLSLQEVLEDQADVSSILSQSVVDQDLDMTELESELDDLIAHDNTSTNHMSPHEDTSTNRTSPLAVNEINDVLGGLCLDDPANSDVSLELPSVPKFDPNSSTSYSKATTDDIGTS